MLFLFFCFAFYFVTFCLFLYILHFFKILVSYFQTMIWNKMGFSVPLLIHYIYIVIIMAVGAITASVPVNWSSSPLFATGTNMPIIVGQFSFMPTSSSTTVTLTYSSALTSTTRYVAMGITDLDYQMTNSSFILKTEIYQRFNDKFQFVYTSNNVAYLNSIKMYYLTVDGAFTQFFNIGYFSSTTSVPYVGPFSSLFYMNFTTSANATVNLAHDNALLAFVHTFDFNSPSFCYDIDIALQFHNDSFYHVIISTSCVGLQVYHIGFSRIIFDKTAIQALGYYFFQYGHMQATSGNPSTLTTSFTHLFPSNSYQQQNQFEFKLS